MAGEADLVMAYANATRAMDKAHRDLTRAREHFTAACELQTAKWKAVREGLNEGRIQPGVYRVGLHAVDEGVILCPDVDLPPLMPMFDANHGS